MTTLPQHQFSVAKNQLSQLMDEVVAGQPNVIRRRKQEMLLVDPAMLRGSLESFRFGGEVVSEGGEVTISVTPVGILGFGATFDEALADAVDKLRDYAARYFEDWAFYSRTDRRAHAPWIVRFAMTPDDEQPDLLTEPPRDV